MVQEKLLLHSPFYRKYSIAENLSPFQPEKVAIQAGRIMLTRIKDLINIGESFAIETTLTTLSYKETIESAKSAGYNVSLVFFWLNDVNLAIERVKLRVKEGGHNIPVETIRRRHRKGIKNLVKIFMKKSDRWVIVDNSEQHYHIIAEGQNDKSQVHDKKKWQNIKKLADEEK